MLTHFSMQNHPVLTILLIAFSQITAVLITNIDAKEEKPLSADRGEAMPFAVVELFTSQGCSSCPSADRLLKEIVQSAKESGKPVYALSFHVDYWDYLGWKDPYSQPMFSERQRRYAQAFGLRGIYTPQMIVNGQDEFVGSREETAKSVIQKAFTQSAICTISITKIDQNDEFVTVNYEISGKMNDAVLNLALVQEDGTSDVKRGENRGRHLENVNIVRDFLSMELAGKKSGVQQLKMPEKVNLGHFSVIAFVQDIETMKILGAVSSAIF